MRLWGRFEAKGYISSLTLSIRSHFFPYRIAQVKLSHTNATTQTKTTQSTSPIQVFP